MEQTEHTEEKNYPKGIFYILLAFMAAGILAILKVTASFSIPITMAILLSFVALPVISMFYRKFHLPWAIGIVIMLVFFIILILVISSLLTTSVAAILAVYPKYESRFLELYKIAASNFGLVYDDAKSLFENLWAQLGIKKLVQSMAFMASNMAVTFVKNFMLVFLLFTFLLAEVSIFQEKISLAFEGRVQYRVKKILMNTIVDVTQFLSIKFIISFATGILIYIGLKLVGIEFPIVWGFLAFVLNFIPTFGSALSCGSIIIFSILQFFPEWPPVILTAIIVVAINFVLGNIIEPRIEGRNLDLSPFFILVSLSLWGWLWGFIGMILAVPLTVIIKIICENISFLRPAAILLGNKKDIKSAKQKESGK